MGVFVQLKIVLAVLLFSTLSFSLMAEERVLCTVSSDIDTDIGKFVYQMDDELRSITHLYQDSYHDGKLTGRIELNPEGLKEGIVLNQKGKYIIVRMHGDNYDAESGGVLYLDTLYNALSGERREYELNLVMDKEGPALISNKVKFNQMKFIANRSRPLGVIGVAKVNFSN